MIVYLSLVFVLAIVLAIGGGTAVAPSLQAADEETGGKALDEFFQGRITALEKNVVTIRYDFSDEKQLEDWVEGNPWPIERVSGQGVNWVDEKLEIVGNTATRHTAEWMKDIRVTATIRLDGEKDIGGFLVPATKPGKVKVWVPR